jgi:hypothetical protein
MSFFFNSIVRQQIISQISNAILLGSNVAYDESMNLRNILWLAPLPSNVTKAWLAPGSLSWNIYLLLFPM